MDKSTYIMKSDHLQRGYKQMYKKDIMMLQWGFTKIFCANFVGNEGHFCSKTQSYVKRYQKMHNLTCDGVVNAELQNAVICKLMV